MDILPGGSKMRHMAEGGGFAKLKEPVIMNSSEIVVPYLVGEKSACMVKLDKLGWNSGFVLAPFGPRLGVRLNGSNHLAEVQDSLPPDWTVLPPGPCELLISLKLAEASQRRGTQNYHLLYAGITRLSRTLELPELLADFREHLFQNIALTAETKSIMPGTVLELNGRGIFFPGGGHSGLIFQPFLDAGAVVHANGLVCVDSQGCASAWADTGPSNPLPLACAYVPVPGKRRKRIRVERLTPGQSSMTLFALSMSARLKSAAMLSVLSQACARLPMHSVRYGESPQDLLTHYRSHFRG